jgi:hypothetical protein
MVLLTMLIEYKDWKRGPKGQILLWWRDDWRSTWDIAMLEGAGANHSTLDYRVKRAVEGGPRYQSVTLDDIVHGRAMGKAKLAVSKITRCPRKALALLVVPAVCDGLPIGLQRPWLAAIANPTCDKKHYAHGQCVVCYRNSTGQVKAKPSPEQAATEAERSKKSDRQRQNALSARRTLYVRRLLEKDEFFDREYIADKCRDRWPDLTEEELPKFVELTYNSYVAQKIVGPAQDEAAAVWAAVNKLK